MNIIPINEKVFKKEVTVRFNNILEGMDNFENEILQFESEEKCIELINKMYDLNKENTYIDFYIKNLNDNEFNNLYNSLINEEKEILEEIKKLRTENTIYFKIEDKKYIPFFCKLCTREIFFITFYFSKTNLTVWGNYNMKFPIFYRERPLF